MITLWTMFIIGIIVEFELIAIMGRRLQNRDSVGGIGGLLAINTFALIAELFGLVGGK